MDELLNVALNEATVLGLRPRPDGGVALLLEVLALPETPDARRELIMSGVSRVRVLLRREIIGEGYGPPIPLDGFAAIEAFFASITLPKSMYGWEFFDLPDVPDDWPPNVSFDVRPSAGPGSHSLHWFNEAGLDSEQGGYTPYCIEGIVEFETLAVTYADGTPLSLEDFAAAGKRWWDDFYRV
ncbi:hypothetical protein SAMN05421504_104379 [Amycolatopsis xylanica]|uniref:Uncharacterized protein n=1 Tax=Amycolatopsis xylanica TaxID=589385 RepID=A0A1H3GSL6_9PSEU|nr:hypothetical protein [Amycolatopsis xylanica]SDY06040.1 hypothetical protein SAMN05421504_104379 [Amycolatopsis xylanica]